MQIFLNGGTLEPDVYHKGNDCIKTENIYSGEKASKKGNSLWLRLCASTARGMGSIPARERKGPTFHTTTKKANEKINEKNLVT